MLLSEAIAALLVATRADGRSPATVASYQRKLKPLVAHLGDVPVTDVMLQNLRGYVTQLLDRDMRWTDHPMHSAQPGTLSPFTIRSYVVAVKRLFSWLADEGIIVSNPARRLKRPQARRTESKGISRVDLVRLLNTTADGGRADLRDRAIILLLADTGCRVGGLCGLQLDDVSFAHNLIRLREKGGKERFAPFLPLTARVLREWMEVRAYRGAAWLFVSLGPKARGRLSTGAVGQMLKRRGKMAGCEGPVNPHSFRHAFARTYLLNGGDLASLSQLLGHASVEVTASYYARFLVQELQEKHAKFSPLADMEEKHYHEVDFLATRCDKGRQAQSDS